MSLLMAASFKRSYKKITKKNPYLAPKIKEAVRIFSASPANPKIDLHKVFGTKYGDWSFSVTGDIRIILTYSGGDAILVYVGGHDEVYGK